MKITYKSFPLKGLFLTYLLLQLWLSFERLTFFRVCFGSVIYPALFSVHLCCCLPKVSTSGLKTWHTDVFAPSPSGNVFHLLTVRESACTFASLPPHTFWVSVSPSDWWKIKRDIKKQHSTRLHKAFAPTLTGNGLDPSTSWLMHVVNGQPRTLKASLKQHYQTISYGR